MKAIAAADENVIVDGEVFIRGEVAYAIMKRVVETGSQMIAVAISRACRRRTETRLLAKSRRVHGDR